MSLRRKIAALLALGCAAVAVTIGLLMHHSRAEQVDAAARSNAVAQLVRLRQVYELTGQVDGADSGAAVDSPALPPALRASALAGRRSTFVDLSGAAPSVWAARPMADGQVLSVRLPLVEERAELADFDRQLLIWGTVVVGLAALGGAVIASRLSRKLRATAATARRISEGELDARTGGTTGVWPGGRRDEVAELGAAVDTMAASLQERIVAEQRFTADVAHELRTPLTGLHTAAELLPDGRPTELVRDRVAALRVLTEDLLEVARLDARAEEPQFDVCGLGPLVEGIARRSGLEVSLPAGESVRTDVRRLERILTNLLTNARRHGAGPVEVRVDGRTVTVRDRGPGFPEELLEKGPRRFVTGTAERGRGTGLGLTIALGQAAVIDAEVRLRNGEDGVGAVVTVTLPSGAGVGADAGAGAGA
ncbi:ATP-binding protein [Streptomyces sp. NPDC050504]|uniref:sensor histidine kinase n=1 Tax=Streptomyces sp. NPDC050504 TaxID=3365618 RepID=UPI0037BD747C